MTKQELEDAEHEFQLRNNVYKIELAQQILKSVYGFEFNTSLKETSMHLEFARQINHSHLCTAYERNRAKS